MKTLEFIDALKRQHSITSDYAAAQLLGLTRSQLSRYRNGKDYPSDDMAMKIADLMGLDPGYVVACIHAERAATEPTRQLWAGIAKRLERAGLAAALAVFMLLGVAIPDASHAKNAQFSVKAGGSEYYVY